MNTSENTKFNNNSKTLHIHLPAADKINSIRIKKTIKDFKTKNEDMSNESNEIGEARISITDEKVKELVRKTSEMKRNSQENDKILESKFDELRQRINNSVTFLRKTKNQIENIKFLHQQDMLNTMNDRNFGDCLQSSDKSLQELNVQMDLIKKKLNAVKEQTKLFKDTPKNVHKDEDFETTVHETVDMLNSIGRGDYNESNFL